MLSRQRRTLHPFARNRVRRYSYFRHHVLEGIEQDGNHGWVLVKLDGGDYLVDAQLASFRALPLMHGRPASTDGGIHDFATVPVRGGFEVQCYPGGNR